LGHHELLQLLVRREVGVQVEQHQEGGLQVVEHGLGQVPFQQFRQEPVVLEQLSPDLVPVLLAMLVDHLKGNQADPIVALDMQLDHELVDGLLLLWIAIDPVPAVQPLDVEQLAWGVEDNQVGVVGHVFYHAGMRPEGH
jgi:hypothetical protein